MNQDTNNTSSKKDSPVANLFDDMGFDEFWDSAQTKEDGSGKTDGKDKSEAAADAADLVTDSLFDDLTASLGDNLDLDLGLNDAGDEATAHFDGLNMHNLFGDTSSLEPDEDEEPAAAAAAAVDPSVTTGNIKSIFAPEASADDDATAAFDSRDILKSVTRNENGDGDGDDDKTRRIDIGSASEAAIREVAESLDKKADDAAEAAKDAVADVAKDAAKTAKDAEKSAEAAKDALAEAAKDGISGAAAELLADKADKENKDDAKADKDIPKASSASLDALADVISTVHAENESKAQEAQKGVSKDILTAIADITGKPVSDENGEVTYPEPEIGVATSDNDPVLLGDDEDSEVRLSERARMGNVYPEGPVIESEHELGTDVQYSDAECKEEKPPVKTMQVFLAVAVVVLVILVGICLYTLFAPKAKPIVNYKQKGAFPLDSGAYVTMYMDAKGESGAMCSDSHGIVLNNGKMVSEFWPGLTGCKELLVSDVGDMVWYLDERDELYAVNLSLDTAFNPHKIIALDGKTASGFDIGHNEVMYFAVNDNAQKVYRRLMTETDTPKDEVLPDDAVPCQGISRDHYAYVSENALHIVRGGKNTPVSLDAAKLGCSVKSLIACTVDRHDNWSVLCEDSIRQGSGQSASAPIPFEDAGIRSGAKRFSLLRNDDGTDLVMADKWLHIDNRGELTPHPFAQALGDDFAFASISNEETPLVGLNNGGLCRISADGQLSQDPRRETNAILGSFFVNYGSMAAVLSKSAADGSLSATLWNVQSGTVQAYLAIPGTDIRELSVSPSGVKGFVVTESGGTRTLHWISWGTRVILLSEADTGIVDVNWSPDESYALVRHADGSHDLYSVGDKVSKVRSYGVGEFVAFAQNDMLWHIEKSEVRVERIADGSRSVVYNRLSELVSDFNATDIVVPNRSNSIVLWGESGLLILDMATGKALRALETPVTWITPNREGDEIACSQGIVDLTSGKVIPLPAEYSSERLHWLGVDRYLEPADNRVFLDFENEMMHSTPTHATPYRIVGANSGYHPSANVILQPRENLMSLEVISTKGALQTVAGFGEHAGAWCWISANGEIQGEGNLCVPFTKPSADGTPVPVTTIAAQNGNVVNYMSAAMEYRELPPVELLEVPFIDKSNVTVNVAAPQGLSFLTFSLADGETGDLPAEFTPDPELGIILATVTEEDGTTKPFQARVAPDSRSFTVMAIDANDLYEPRMVTFRPVYKDVSLRIPLLMVGASDITLKWVNADEPDTVLDISEDIEIELKSMIHANRDAIKACLAIVPDTVLSVTVNEDDNLVALNTLPDEVKTCLAPIMESIQKQRDEGALPDFPEYGNIVVSVEIP